MQDNNKLIAFSELRNEGCGQEIPFLSFFDDQSLTSEQKDNVLRKLNIADEKLNLTIDCDNPSAVIGATVTVAYDNNTQQYTWEGQTIAIVIPIFSEYTVSFSRVEGYYAPDSFSYLAKRNVVKNITVSYDSAPYTDLSLKGINGEDLPQRETANCYVIKSTGYYEFPLVYGNAIANGEANTSSYTQTPGEYTQPFYNYLNNQIISPFIETDTGIEAASGTVVYSDTDTQTFDISGIKIVQRDLCKYLRFQVNAFPALGGNAMLSVKDANGQIMWSWHIWAYADTLTTKAHNNGKGYTYNFLDVNLGWVKDAAGSKYGTCPFYQWGRKDPMLRAAGSSSVSNPPVSYGTWSITNVAPSVAATIQNPNVFNKAGTNNNWWVKDDVAVNFYNYWDASQTAKGNADKAIVKTVYDPCPVGYCIPCGNAFLGFSTSNGGTWDKGYVWDNRYFPATGYRNSSGDLGNVGANGNYWLASSSSQPYVYRLNFFSGNVKPQNDIYRAYGFSVCPVLIQ